jgi:RNA polymerase sigma-70 factor (ECF subfamily)
MLLPVESYKKAEEEVLIKASLEGDKAAFGEIVNRYQKMVARTVKGMLGDTVFSEDIGQEVFIKLYHSLADFRGDAKLSTYIQRIAVNLTLNELKRRKRPETAKSMNMM